MVAECIQEGSSDSVRLLHDRLFGQRGQHRLRGSTAQRVATVSGAMITRTQLECRLTSCHTDANRQAVTQTFGSE